MTVDMLTFKGIYPYEFVTDKSKFAETAPPSKEMFFSSLSKSGITDDEYKHAQKVWDQFGMQTFHEYHDRYLLTDVILLADVFQHFRNMSLSSYGLDPLHYYTAPGLSFDACLKMSKVRLDFNTDNEQMLFVEKEIRGGISTITQRYSKANNKLMPHYNPEEPSTFITYLDCNNLYGKKYDGAPAIRWFSIS